MFFDIYDIFQNIRIREASHQARRARDLAGDLGGRIEALERQLDMAMMTSEALWTIIKRHHGLSNDDLAALVKEIAAREDDPELQAAAERARPCPQCGKALQKSTGSCLYCGFKADPEPFSGA